MSFKMPQTTLPSPSADFPSESRMTILSGVRMGLYLEGYGMYMEENLLDKPEHANFRQLAYDIVDPTRSSAKETESTLRLEKELRFAKKTRDEATALGTILPCIIKSDSKLSHSKGSIEEPSISDALIATDEDFEDSGMDVVFDQKLARHFMPSIYLDIGVSGWCGQGTRANQKT